MLIYDSGYPREKQTYKAYKAEKVNKAKERLRATLIGVRESSLTKEDKQKLYLELAKQINEFK